MQLPLISRKFDCNLSSNSADKQAGKQVEKLNRYRYCTASGNERKTEEQVAQLSQTDRATHQLLRFAKLRSGIFEPPFGDLGEK